MYQLIAEATKVVPNFNEEERKLGRETLYDTFIKVWNTICITTT